MPNSTVEIGQVVSYCPPHNLAHNLGLPEVVDAIVLDLHDYQHTLQLKVPHDGRDVLIPTAIRRPSHRPLFPGEWTPKKEVTNG